MRAVLNAADLPERACALHVRSQGGLRRRGRVCRAADAQCAPHRGAGDRRRPTRSPASASANARCSGASRSWWRSRRARRCSPALRERITQAALRMAQAVGYQRPGHLRVPGRRAVGAPALRLHRGQSAAAGRAHGDRSRHRARPGPVADRASRPGSRWPSSASMPNRTRGAARLRGPMAHQCRDARCAKATRGRPAARCRASTCLPAPACASTRTATRASRLRRTTTRCSPS